MAAASIADHWAPRPKAMHAAAAATPRGDTTESALLARFAEYERIGAETHQEPLAGSLVSLASAMPGGDGGGLRLYSGVLVPDGECTFDEVRNAALRDELRDHRGLPCAPSSFAPQALADGELLGWSPPCRPRRAWAPRRSGSAGPYPERRTGQCEGPGGWKVALED